jgi:hypothetical protein
MQPISLVKTGGGGPDYVWPYHEFRDNVDVPAGYTYKFRVKLDDRALADGTTMGGGLGRWLFHCHIFFHATNGMLGELVVVAPNGNEKPDVNADTTAVTANEGSVASATGTYHDIDGDAVTLSASRGAVTDTGGGHWSWSYTTTNGPAESGFVYVTATDAGRSAAIGAEGMPASLPPIGCDAPSGVGPRCAEPPRWPTGAARPGSPTTAYT